MEKETNQYSIEQASDEADVLGIVNNKSIEEFGVDNYSVAEKILESEVTGRSEVAGRIRDYQNKYGAGQGEIGVSDYETENAEKVRMILAHTTSAIYTGLDGLGHKEFSQGSPDIAADPHHGTISLSIGRLLKLSPGQDVNIFKEVRSEFSKIEAGSREKLYIVSSPDSDKFSLIYQAVGGQEWIDPSGRGGQELIVKVDGTLSEISSLAEIIRDDPIIVRELARQVVIEKIGIDETTWEFGSDRTSSHPLKPPYEIWDKEIENPSYFLYSEIGTVTPTHERLNLK